MYQTADHAHVCFSQYWVFHKFYSYHCNPHATAVLMLLLQDNDYKEAGAKIVDHGTALQQDIVLKVRPPSMEEVDQLKERAK